AFDIESAFVCLYEGRGAPAAQSRLLLAHGGRREGSLQSLFPSRELVPRGALPSDRAYVYIVGPLFGREGARGYLLLEWGPREGLVYRAIQEQIGAALHRMEIRERLLEEVARREAAEKDRLEREMQIAARIQTGLLPRSLAVQGLELSAATVPATE